MEAVAPIADVSIGDVNDDTEANEDLSLKVIEMEMQRANPNDAIFDSDIVTNLSDESNNELKEETKIMEETEEGEDAKKEKKSEAEKVGEVVNKAEETNPVQTSDNMVLRRLLRGPRYFDPPDSGWGACYNCGEEGHAAVNCTAAKRKKPCFICGSLEHNARQCAKAKDCFICKKGGHRAKDCPEKERGQSQNYKICLKCGDAGHDMFLCRNSYHPDDLKEIQCYICRSFGHLCCVEYTDSGPREVSCYRCGLLGHTGLACSASYGETSGARSLNPCYRCGEEGHYARECTSSTKVGKKVRKRNRESSTPKKRSSRDNRVYESRSAPPDLGKARKMKKPLYAGEYASGSKSKHRGGWSTEDPRDFPDNEDRFGSSSKSKRRGGWITEDPGDFSSSKRQPSGWRSPATPSNKRARNSNFTGSDHASSSRSSRKSRKLNFSNSASHGSPIYNHHRFSASRFGNNNSNGAMRRSYEWS